MLKKSKVVLLKAITMGALLANGGIGTEGEDDKQKKDLNFPLPNAMVHGAATEATLMTGGSGGGDFHRSLIEPYVRNILVQVDERVERRRELLRKPIKVDLRGAPIRGILPFHKVLNTLLADAQKYDVPLNLTLLNATQAELSELLNHPNAPFIKELDWNYEVPLIDDMDAYDLLEDEKTGGEEEWTDETTGFTPTSEDSDEEWVDETIGFTPTSEDSDEEWVDETTGFTPTSEDSDEEWIDDPIGFVSEDFDEEWINDPIRVIKDDLDEEVIYDLLGFMRDAPVEEQANDLLRLVRDDVPEEEQADELLRLVRDVPEEEQADDPVREVKAEPRITRWKRAVARAKYMPSLEQLADDFGQKGIITLELDEDVIVDKGDLADENQNPQLSGWSMTLIKNAEGNSDLNVQDSSQLKNITNRASHNLVQIFCRGG